MKITIIAEKPSVAREIANIVGANRRQDGYLENDQYFVTWAFGHLVGLAPPEAYGAVGFNKNHLPITPKEFVLTPRILARKEDAGAVKQLNIIDKLFKQSDRIIVATDAGREGELIFRYIYTYLKCDRPFDRLWISSLTEKAIRAGLDNLKNGKAYDNLYAAAKARSEADWLVGINATQALTISSGQGVYSLGRVQTPTLCMIASRYLDYKNFVAKPYWQNKVFGRKGDFGFGTASNEKHDNRESAQNIDAFLKQSGKMVVKAIETKTANEDAPLLYDLTSLQREANTKHGFSADKTLSLAQKLYEQKCITYPRTGSRYLSEDVFEEIPQLIEVLKRHTDYGKYAMQLDSANLNKRSVNGDKVTDHHALLITENVPIGASKDLQTIYNMVASRMLEAFSEKCVKERTVVTFVCGEHTFTLNGTTIIERGWRTLLGFSDDDKEDELPLAGIIEGEEIVISDTQILEKKTVPKPLHTEATLLSAMENAGKELEDEAEREAMKESGIGTPATRAAIIETLFTREYIHRANKSLVPTPKGLYVFDVVKETKIADASLTGGWEKTISQIENGERDAESFNESIRIFSEQITKEMLSVDKVFEGQVRCKCPKCGSAINFFPKIAKCQSQKCEVKIFRSIAEKMISDNEIIELLTNGKTKLLRGFKSKAGKLFEAYLVLDSEYRLQFEFAPRKGKAK